MKYVLFLVMFLFSTQAVALDCSKQPTCAELNYSTEDNPKCDKNGYILCPYDQSYKKCVQYSCEALGFTQSDKSDWCADIATCKGDKSYTLCQKPCIAWDYETLSSLAESGKCKIITMKKDITIPLNQGITLAENTLIDGSGHTLKSTGNRDNLTIFSMNDKTGMKNIKLQHTQTETQTNVRLLKTLEKQNAVSLKDMEIFVSFDASTSWTTVIESGVYNISGKFMLEMNKKSEGQMAGFWGGTYNFTDAQVSINKSGGANIFDICQVTVTNSTFQADTSNYLFVRTSAATFKNSEASLKGGALFSAPEMGSKLDLVLEGKSVLELELKKETGKDRTTIQATDTTGTLILDGVTYRPIKEGTTKLSEIETSADWQKQN